MDAVITRRQYTAATAAQLEALRARTFDKTFEGHGRLAFERAARLDKDKQYDLADVVRVLCVIGEDFLWMATNDETLADSPHLFETVQDNISLLQEVVLS